LFYNSARVASLFKHFKAYKMVKNDNPKNITLQADSREITVVFLLPLILFGIFWVKDAYQRTQGKMFVFLLLFFTFFCITFLYRIVKVEVDIIKKTLCVQQVYAVFWQRPKTIKLSAYNIYYQKTTPRRGTFGYYVIVLSNTNDSISISEDMGYTESELRDLYTKIYRLCRSAKSDA
jgi:hypothetical protein